MKKAKFTIQKQDISEYPTNKQKIVKGTKFLGLIGAGVCSILIIIAIFSAVNGAYQGRQEQAAAEQTTKIISTELIRWNEASSKCGIESSVSKVPIDEQMNITLNLEIPFGSLKAFNGSVYQNQIKCFTESIYGLSLTDNFKFGEELANLQKNIYLDSKFNKSEGTQDGSGLWVSISSAASDLYFGNKRDSLIITFWWSQ